MGNIFISYRRDDSRDATGRIFDRLKHHFGPDAVFMDVDAIPLGIDFRDHVNDRLDRCDLVLAVIGDNWLVDENGPSPNTHIEISSALKRGNIPLIPVLVGSTGVPTPEQLPEDIAEFSYRNGIEIRSDRNFEGQIADLIVAIEKVLKPQTGNNSHDAPAPAEPAAPKATGGKNRLVMAGIALLLIGGGVYGYLSMPGSEITKPEKITSNDTVDEDAANLEEAERQRIAVEEAERKRLAEEAADRERIATQDAERQRIAAEVAERERIAAQEAERQRIAAREAERQRIAAQEAERQRIAEEEARRRRALNPRTIPIAGKTWMAENLNIETSDSKCWGDKPANCEREGRMYTWQGARLACPMLGAGWRLPTDADWLTLTRPYGAAYGDPTSNDEGLSAYTRLAVGGDSGFGGSYGGKNYYFNDEKIYSFYDFSQIGYYWADNYLDTAQDSARIFTFRSSDSRLLREGQTVKSYSSVRCVHD